MQGKLKRPPGQEAKPVASKAILQQMLLENARKYDEMSSRYDIDRFQDGYGRYDFTETRLLIQSLVTQLTPQPSEGWRALDVACGTGKTAIAVAQLGREVIGLDAALGMLQKCSANAIASDVQSRLRLTEASADEVPYRNDSFDMVISFRFLHLFPIEAYPALIREMVRVVKPGGHVILEFNNSRYAGLPRALDILRQRIQTGNLDGIERSSVNMQQLAMLANRLGVVELESVTGSLLPKGWMLATNASLARSLRQLGYGPLKSIAAHLVAVFRKNR